MEEHTYPLFASSTPCALTRDTMPQCAKWSPDETLYKNGGDRP
jgi:hypothetical protein